MTAPSRARPVVAAVFAGASPEAFVPTLVSLGAAHPELTVVAGAPDLESLAPLVALGASAVEATSASDLVALVSSTSGGHVLLVHDATLFPAAALDRALAALDGDMRVATVSFLCNAAAFLSFPYRNDPVSHQVASDDEESITRRLRTTVPDQAPAPIAFAVGPAVLLSAFALSAVGPLTGDADGRRADVAVADFSLRARHKGFLALVDPDTFVSRPYDLGRVEDPWLDPDEHRWLIARHPYAAWMLDDEMVSACSPLATVHAASRAKVLGLRVLIDGSCLGAKEMGTQVQTTSLAAALARRPDVEKVCVALVSDVPRYAAALVADPKVETCFAPGTDVSGYAPVDIAHRPFQPVDVVHPSWFKVAARTVVTIQDLTSYHVGAYHESSDEWRSTRHAMQHVTAKADGVVVISHDVGAHLALERLPVDPGRVFVVENGTDHLRGDEAESVPTELLARGFVAGRFALVLGTNYAHKNREIAIDVVAELRRRGLDLSLVLAGAAVPYGSSRVPEAVRASGRDDVFTIPDVTSEERNWLLHHADVVLYPTSAEGFGLVPYEAARFGTPTVLVPFGPLGEVVGDLPVAAADWSATALADAAEELLADPATARAQVASALRSGQDYTWDATAAKLVEVYRTLLAAPARGGDAGA